MQLSIVDVTATVSHPTLNNQGGGVYQNNTINLNNSFDYTFNVFLGCNTNGADGIVFILTNNITGIGANGGVRICRITR
jgi:hypothetical protein